MFLVDSHCHFDLLEIDPKTIIKNAEKNDVKHFLNVCVTLENFPRVLHDANSFNNVSASVGLHPNEIVTQEPSTEELIQLGKTEKVVAIGETGLDYYRTTDDLENQRQRFRRHIRAAKELNKPLIVHSRQAKDDTLKILREEDAREVGGVLHCFTEDWDMAMQALDLNFYISFSGIVTFKNAVTIQEAAAKVPLDRMLIETDSPYLAPVPYRGKPNEPAYVRHVAEFIATLRGVELAIIAEHTTHNFFTLFKTAQPYV